MLLLMDSLSVAAELVVVVAAELAVAAELERNVGYVFEVPGRPPLDDWIMVEPGLLPCRATISGGVESCHLYPSKSALNDRFCVRLPPNGICTARPLVQQEPGAH